MAATDICELDNMVDNDVDNIDEVREFLIMRLRRITHIDALKKITNYLNLLHLPEDVYIISPEEEQIIDESEAELDAGLGIPLEIFKKNTREWLGKLTTDFA
ncbi:hypothetical protein FACS189427_11130 [Planctomycetales bacterium]|nr:hypothetical protein FACS189427_11130 [Planctomycetales bacterium]